MLLIADDLWAILTIWQEARGESYEGKLAVARVIRNRMRLKYASDGTAAGTVLLPYQFSGWNSKGGDRLHAAKINSDDPVVKDCTQAWLASVIKDPGIGNAVLYYNPHAVPTIPAWAVEVKRVTTIGKHIFFNG